MRILVLANNGTGLYKFRKELLEKLLETEEVYICLPKDEYTNKLEELGCHFIETNIDRRGTNPFRDMMLIMTYFKIFKKIKPNIVLTYTIKPNVYGGIACRIAKIPYITNVTGLGTSIESKGVLQKISMTLYKIGLKKSECVFFQNNTNKNIFINKNIINKKSRLLPGSGVNISYHNFENYPQDDKEIRFLFIGRMMKAKGIEELFIAAEKLKPKYPFLKFEIIGGMEEDYTEKINQLEDCGIIKHHHKQNDIHSFIKNNHATILPSYHEGMSNVLLESAATGRPVIASNVAGCIETFDEQVSGIGFEKKNAESLINTLEQFIKLPYDQKKAMGIAGRLKMEREFNRNKVINAYIEEINEIQLNDNNSLISKNIDYVEEYDPLFKPIQKSKQV